MRNGYFARREKLEGNRENYITTVALAVLCIKQCFKMFFVITNIYNKKIKDLPE
jgi:hypothetical protein